MIAVLVAVSLLVSTGDELTDEYERVWSVAVDRCPLNKRPTEEQQMRLRELLLIEQREGVPKVARGLLAAAACHESAYLLRVSCGDGGRSCGMLQLSPSHNKRLRKFGAVGRDPRSDWRAVARYWLWLVRRQLPRVTRDCVGRGGYDTREEYLWASANKTATWRYACGRWGRCIERDDGGTCTRKACVSQAARCSIPPWRWRRSGKHRRQETKHWARVRDWRSAAPYTEQDETGQ